MPYYQTDDIPESTLGKVKPHLKMTSPEGTVIFNYEKSNKLRQYYKEHYAPQGCNGKRIWREELIKLGYKIEKVWHE